MPENKFDERGWEKPDPTPLARAIAFHAPPSLQDQIRRMIAHEMSQQAALNGQETFEEADDFDVGDDYDPKSPWELDEDQLQAESHEQERRRENANATRSARHGPRKRRGGDPANDETGGAKSKTPDAASEGGDAPAVDQKARTA